MIEIPNTKCAKNGSCIRSQNLCEDCLEFQKGHSAVAERATTLKEITAHLEEQAKQEWFKGDKATADKLREVWQHFEKLRADTGKLLDKYILASMNKPSQ